MQYQPGERLTQDSKFGHLFVIKNCIQIAEAAPGLTLLLSLAFVK